jgi:uridine kinase
MAPYLIGIAGPSGSGKTELSRFLARELNAPILAVDSYYADLAHLPLAERARANFDVPDSIDHLLFTEHLSEVAAGRGIAVPVYDFAQYSRTGETEPLIPGEFAIVEGLFALYWADVRALLGAKVYVDAEDGICYARRLARDVAERGRSPESVSAQYRATVRPMAERYILPTRAYADIVISGIAPAASSAGTILGHVRGV